MLYQITKSRPVNESAPGLLLIPEFEALFYDGRVGDKWMRFVMLVADYDSPLKQHPERKRREMALLAVGFTTEETKHTTLDSKARAIRDGKNEKIEAALKKYKEIQFNEDKETLMVINTQIESIKRAVMEPTTDATILKARNALLDGLPDLIEVKKKIARMSNITEEVFENETTTDSRPMSLIDKVALENQEAKL